MQIESLSDLETRGFVLVRGFLGEAEMQLLRDDFAHVSLDDNRNYNSKSPTAAVMERLTPRIDEVLRQVNEQTKLHVDVHVPNTSNYFATDAAEGVSFPWHQDHESYFVVQNHFDYLNFYMPFTKPDTTKSNLSVIPFDELQRTEPRAYKFVVNRGAGTYRAMGGRWLVTNDDSGGSRLISTDLGTIAVTPELAEGDLLLLRGDIIHRTQDTDTNRVALSWRVADGATVLKRKRLAAGGVRKAVMMRNNTVLYQKVFKAFDLAHKDEMPLSEMLDAFSTMTTPEPVDRQTFLRQLVREKRRAHVLTRFVANVPVAMGFKGLDRAKRSSNPR